MSITGVTVLPSEANLTHSTAIPGNAARRQPTSKHYVCAFHRLRGAIRGLFEIEQHLAKPPPQKSINVTLIIRLAHSFTASGV